MREYSKERGCEDRDYYRSRLSLWLSQKIKRKARRSRRTDRRIEAKNALSRWRYRIAEAECEAVLHKFDVEEHTQSRLETQ